MWLYTDQQTFKHRLAALEKKKAAAEGLVLTEAQVAALARKREQQLAMVRPTVWKSQRAVFPCGLRLGSEVAAAE